MHVFMSERCEAAQTMTHHIQDQVSDAVCKSLKSLITNGLCQNQAKIV